MADAVENLMPGHLKRFHPTPDRVERTHDELLGRIASFDGSTCSIIAPLGCRSVADAARRLGIDNINRRLDRVGHRLELTS